MKKFHCPFVPGKRRYQYLLRTAAFADPEEIPDGIENKKGVMYLWPQPSMPWTSRKKPLKVYKEGVKKNTRIFTCLFLIIIKD